jgi:dTDP-L-rhamnose 4-epimerase
MEPVIKGNFRLGDLSIIAGLTKAKEELSFVQRHNFETGVSKFIEWVNAQSIKGDKYSASIEKMKEKGLFK